MASFIWAADWDITAGSFYFGLFLNCPTDDTDKEWAVLQQLLSLVN